MKRLISLCLGAAAIIGGSANAAFSCGGHGGGTGCKVASLPLTVDSLALVIRWLEIVIP